MGERRGTIKRLKMAQEAAEEAIMIQAWRNLTTGRDESALRALDFQLTRMCVAYEDYEKELAYYKTTDFEKKMHIELLALSPEKRNLIVLFNKIHTFKLALAHEKDGFSVEDSRQALLEQLSSCKGYFEALISRTQKPRLQQPTVVATPQPQSHKTPSPKKTNENSNPLDLHKTLQERLETEKQLNKQLPEPPEKTLLLRQTNKRSPLSTITNQCVYSTASSSSCSQPAANKPVTMTEPLQSAKKAKRV